MKITLNYLLRHARKAKILSVSFFRSQVRSAQQMTAENILKLFYLFNLLEIG